MTNNQKQLKQLNKIGIILDGYKREFEADPKVYQSEIDQLNKMQETLKNVKIALEKTQTKNTVSPKENLNTPLLLEDNKEEFNIIYNNYITECENNQLTDEKRKEYRDRLLEIIEETKTKLEEAQKLKDENPSEENLGVYNYLKEEAQDYQNRFDNLPNDCSKEDEQESFKIFQITFYDYPLIHSNIDSSLEVNAGGSGKNGEGKAFKHFSVETNLPKDLFHEWSDIRAEGGMIEWGEVGVLSIVSGSEKSRKIKLKIEGTAGNYGDSIANYRAHYHSILEARSQPILVKVEKKGKDKWKKAKWHYKLDSGEKTNKSIKETWGGRFSKFYLMQYK